MNGINTFTAYTKITSDLTLSGSEKLLLCLIYSFNQNGNSRGLDISDDRIGELLGLKSKTVNNYLSRFLKENRIAIVNKQSKYRRILLPPNSGSTLPINDGSTSNFHGPTSTKKGTNFHHSVEHNKITKFNKKTKGVPPLPAVGQAARPGDETMNKNQKCTYCDETAIRNTKIDDFPVYLCESHLAKFRALKERSQKGHGTYPTDEMMNKSYIELGISDNNKNYYSAHI